ncbi:MAG TPA: penicillin-binding protein 2 [Syntrophomonadaceae bacterium]|nr:penicillin-binding protein 2 [Syntrophomonadaceae bacterium]
MKQGDLKLKLKIYTGIVIGLLVILGIRLAVVQLFLGDVYKTRAKDNQIRLVSIKAPRGEIYSSDNSVMAANELVYTLSLNYLGVKNQDTMLERLAGIVDDYYPEVTSSYIKEKIKLQKYRLFEPVTIMRNIPWDLVVKIEENRQYLPGVDVSVEPLRYYPMGSIAGHVLGYIHSINQQELDASNRKYSMDSLIGKSGIEKQYEDALRGKDGARQVEVDARGRPVGELVTLNPKPGNNLYLTIDSKLQKVMEKSMADTLKSLQSSYPKARVGSAVLLNVKTGAVLAMCSSPALNPNDFRGHLDPKLNTYYFPQGDKYNPLQPGAEVNRAIQSSYPPGSTFKPITGMAALEKGVMDPLNDFVDCRGRYWVAPYIKCTGVHGNVDYYSAMAHSCNTYFQEMGRRAGKDQIINIAQQFGLGSKTGIDLPQESSGLLPTPAWKKQINSLLINHKYDTLRKQLQEKYTKLINEASSEEERSLYEKEFKNEKVRLEANYNIEYNFDTKWQMFDTLNMSIGQGSNDYTPLQLANYVAAIANGGELMEPYVVSKITNHDGKVLKQFEPQLTRKINVSPDTLAETKHAMLAVTQSGGTAAFLFSNFPANIKVGAKTGTAETGRQGDNAKKEFHGVFIAFAPFDNPEIAFAGVVEYGYSGSTSAGLVAKAVFEQYFGIVDHMAEIDAADQSQAEKAETTSTNNPH